MTLGAKWVGPKNGLDWQSSGTYQTRAWSRINNPYESAKSVKASASKNGIISSGGWGYWRSEATTGAIYGPVRTYYDYEVW